MQKVPFLAAAGSLVGLLACGGAREPGTRSVVLFHTSDEHSALLGSGPEGDAYASTVSAGLLQGGVARRATLLQQERLRAEGLGALTFTFSSGDNVSGSLFQAVSLKTAPDFRSLQALGYGATTLGNHDFDQGPEYLAGVLAAAVARGGMPPVVATNLRFSGTGGDAALRAMAGADRPIRASLVISQKGFRLGVLGVMGQQAASVAPLTAPVTFSQGAELHADLAKAAEDLRKQEHVDLVVLLAHAGTDPANPAGGESHQLALDVPGIDVVLSGHSHVQTAPYTVRNRVTGRNVVVAEAGSHGSHLGRLVLRLDKDGVVELDGERSQLLPVTDRVPAAPGLKPLLDEAIAALETDREWNGSPTSMLERSLAAIEGVPVPDDPSRPGDLFFRPLVQTRFDLSKVLRQESGLLRLAADAFLGASIAHPESKPAWMPEVGLTAYGLVRGDLPKGYTGVLTLADAFRVCSMGLSPDQAGHATPGYPLVRMAMPLAELKLIFELTALTPDLDVNGADQFILPSGATFTFDRTRPPVDLANPSDPARGRVTGITLTLPGRPDLPWMKVFDAAQPAWAPFGGWNPENPFGYPLFAYVPVTVTTDLYLALMAMSMGLPMWHPLTDPAQIGNPSSALRMENLPALMLWRPDGSALKSYEAFAMHLRSLGLANGGFLPDRYADLKPSRVVPQ